MANMPRPTPQKSHFKVWRLVAVRIPLMSNAPYLLLQFTIGSPAGNSSTWRQVVEQKPIEAVKAPVQQGHQPQPPRPRLSCSRG